MTTLSLDQTKTGEMVIAHSAGPERIRFQLLWNAILRIERSRPDGTFCDEPTFTVLARQLEGMLQPMPGTNIEIALADHDFTLRSMADTNTMDELYQSLRLEREGTTLWSAKTDPGRQSDPPQPDRLPRPRKAGPVWALHDRPRALPPAWGSLPPPPNFDGKNSGWQFESEAQDVYLFLYHGDIRELYRLVTLLTGPIPLPPLWAFGFWHSRYYPYNDRTVPEIIDRYRAEGFPLDVFVIDTDWRVGASRGYEINTELFPDMAGTLRECAQRGVHTLFNDHPEPRGFSPLDPGLFQYRHDNLVRMIDKGLTTWWFDRNWLDIIEGPVPGLNSAVWGQKLYWDIVSNHTPDRRTVLLSMTADHPAAHRYPLWWTGDNESDWAALGQAVRDSVDEGLQLRPYTGEDIGGHLGYPSPEQYVRWMQWGAVSPTFRVHSGPHNRFRYPWRFGETALGISRDYVHLRYRLLPLLYMLARQAHDTGMPILRSMELFDPNAPAWTREQQFGLGNDLVLAPVIEPAREMTELRTPVQFDEPLQRRVWFEPVWAEQSRRREDPPQGPPDDHGYDHEIRIDAHNWSEKLQVWKRGFFALWDGSFEVPEDGWYVFRLQGNGRKSLVVNEDYPDQLIGIFDTGDREVTLPLAANTRHHITVTCQHFKLVQPAIQLSMAKAPEPEALPSANKQVWVPPGEWRDLWTGEVFKGPATIVRPASIHQLPAFARVGSIVPLGPIPECTGKAVWDSLTWEIFTPEDGERRSFTLYEDDGGSNACQQGMSAETAIHVERPDTEILIQIEKPQGPFADAINRQYCFLRIHLPPDNTTKEVMVDDIAVSASQHLNEGDPRPSWKRLTTAESIDRRTPFSIVPDGDGLPGNETVLVIMPTHCRELAIRIAP